MRDKTGRRNFIKLTLGTTMASGLGITSSVLAAKDDWFTNINRIKNPVQLTNLERSHVPIISIPEEVKSGETFMINSKVGEEGHLMTAGHRISWIELYVENTLIARTEFTASAPRAEVSIPVVLMASSTIKVWSYCTSHGLWENKKKVEVE